MRRKPIVPKHEDSNGWWITAPNHAPAQKLSSDQRYRTVIVGAGICGVSVARRLAELRPDETIALLEAERAGFGASGRNAGFMLNMHSHGEPKALSVLRRNANLWAAGLEHLRETVRDYQIQCDWSDWGRLYGSAGRDGEKHLDEIATTLEALEMPFERLDHDRMFHDLGTPFYLRGLHVPGNALVNPAAMVAGLARTLPENVDLFEESPVTGIQREGRTFKIETPDGRVQADQVILAAGVFMQAFGVARNRYVPMATYASLTEPLSDENRATFGIEGEFGLLASSENGATIRLTRDGRLFVRNKFTFAPGAPPGPDTVAACAKLHRDAMLARWPHFQHVKFEHSWGGIMAFTTNNGAVFGEIEPGLFAVLTNDVSPMTRGAASGRLLAEYIEAHDSELLTSILSMPMGKRLPPRPILDLGIAWRLHAMHRAGAKEF